MYFIQNGFAMQHSPSIENSFMFSSQTKVIISALFMCYFIIILTLLAVYLQRNILTFNNKNKNLLKMIKVSCQS